MTGLSRLRNMALLGRLESAARSAWLPLALLLLALSTVFIFGGDREYFYRGVMHNFLSSHHLTIAVNISPEHGFQRFYRQTIEDDGVTRYRPYNRFPFGGYPLVKLATLPFGGDPPAQIIAARMLMLLIVSGAAILAYLSICRLTSNRWIALTATLLAFSSYYLLYFNDTISPSEVGVSFGLMLTFHGMVVFVQEGRFRQLLVKTCIGLLLGWVIFALLLPFIIIGLASDLVRSRSSVASPHPSTLLHRGRPAASVLLRSRYLLLGIVALGFGMAILTFNFTMEYVALDGETPVTEMPSFQSMLVRVGGNSDWNANYAPYLAWPHFLKGQFRSILRMFIPYSLLGSLGYRGDGAQSPTWLSESQGVALGVVLSAACLIGSMFVRPRILFATLASFGFFWALPMRNTTALHDFEAIYYVGLPLAFFTIILLLARRLTNRGVVIAGASVLALLLFTVSSFQMSRIGYSAEAAREVREAEQDFLAIRELTAGQFVNVIHLGGTHKKFFGHASHAVDFYLNTSLIRYGYLPTVEGGFVVMRARVDTDALLTPHNRQFFLYDRAGLAAWYGARYRAIASGEPVAREVFDVYLVDGTAYYLREPCDRAVATGRLFLHVYPIDTDDLPDVRKRHGFDNLDFEFVERGLLFDGKCLASVDLPQYDIVKIHTGRGDGDAWSATHIVLDSRLTSRYQSIVSREPVERSEFDLYFDDGTVHYVKEPCTGADTTLRFFLHVVPADPDDLPGVRKQHGFDNLDFDFVGRGLLFDGKCLASVDLPQYDVASVGTGQFGEDGVIWSAEFAPDE